MKPRNFCENFEQTIKNRIIQKHVNSTTDSKEKTLWKIDEDYDWSCLTGCPPGFECSENAIKTCPSGASNFESKSCSFCPTGHVCIPGRLPYPCPLGQYVKLVNGAEKITFAGTEFEITTKYTCKDCPREFSHFRLHRCWRFGLGSKFEYFFSNLSIRLMWPHFSTTTYFILAGHKCGFAADKPKPCPKDQFNSYFNQTTCQECDIGLGEKCYKHGKEVGSLITGQDHISDAIGPSYSNLTNAHYVPKV